MIASVIRLADATPEGQIGDLARDINAYRVSAWLPQPAWRSPYVGCSAHRALMRKGLALAAGASSPAEHRLF
jgi:hypothetical protein